MTDNVPKQDKTDDRPAYDPPRALSLSHMGTGIGGAPHCTLPGSAAGGECGTGLAAVSGCLTSGSSATGCLQDGNAATEICTASGSGAPE